MKILKYFSLALVPGVIASFCTFLVIALVSGAGGFAQTRAKDAWVYPVSDLFSSSGFYLLTERTVQKIFEENLQGYPRGRERELARHFVKTCKRNRFDPAFVLSLIAVESGFRVNVRSSAGAIGLLQIMPATAGHIARRKGHPYAGVKSLKDPFVNITLGVSYLAELRDRYQGMSPYFHLAAFNLGPARLDELRARPGFRPSKTLKYYEDVMKGVDRWRYYSTRQAESQELRTLRRRAADKPTRLRSFQASVSNWANSVRV